jgi:acetylglutamate kinase
MVFITKRREDMESIINKATILIEALPYIQRLRGKTIVIKYGGNAMGNDSVTQSIMQDITLLKYVGMNPIVVHGGGPEINRLLDALSIKSSFHKGLRITDKNAIDVVQMVLAGKINKDIVSILNSLGGRAVGLCGKDGNLIEVEKMPPVDGVDLGFVGEIKKINPNLLELLAKDEYIPVVSPIGIGKDGQSYNINADTVAGRIAWALKAEKLIFLTDIDGIRRNPADPSSLISVVTAKNAVNLIEQGIINGGMIPKVSGCIEAVKNGVNCSHIVNGTIPHPIVLEIFTDKGIGTMMTE